MNNKGNPFLVVIAGVAFGAALGMLFTPNKGTVTRRIIRRKGEAIADDVIESIKEPIDQFSDMVTETLEKLKKDLRSRFCS